MKGAIELGMTPVETACLNYIIANELNEIDEDHDPISLSKVRRYG